MTATAASQLTTEVVRNRLDVIADEMETVLLRSSHSIVIKEGGDATCAIFDGPARRSRTRSRSPSTSA